MLNIEMRAFCFNNLQRYTESFQAREKKHEHGSNNDQVITSEENFIDTQVVQGPTYQNPRSDSL